MGGFCGWSGKGLGLDISREAIKAMLAECRGTAASESASDCNDTGALGICEGLYATNYLKQHGIRVAITGSPTWDDSELSEITKLHGIGAALVKAYRAYGKESAFPAPRPFCTGGAG